MPQESLKRHNINLYECHDPNPMKYIKLWKMVTSELTY